MENRDIALDMCILKCKGWIDIADERICELVYGWTKGTATKQDVFRLYVNAFVAYLNRSDVYYFKNRILSNTIINVEGVMQEDPEMSYSVAMVKEIKFQLRGSKLTVSKPPMEFVPDDIKDEVGLLSFWKGEIVLDGYYVRFKD